MVAFLSTCFVLLVARNQSKKPNLHVKQERLSALKKQYIGDEIELNWKRQEISELEEKMNSMRGSFEETAHRYLMEKEALRKGNEKLEKALSDSNRFNREHSQRQHPVHDGLTEELERENAEIMKKHAENIYLRMAIAEMKETIEKETRLRGNKIA